ncbi:MAG: DUF2344 domain-containing protein [Sedimentisphaerales bacterium]|nr:DUF2344 domain-containing protein [Sedimentisphaerales bacterium]
MNSIAVTLAGRYKIHGDVRFLSHQETMRVIQRAIIRSGIGLVYSQGYNPRPRLSLPLPKSVGVASDDELFCVKIRPQFDDICFTDLIAARLPDGFELTSVQIHDKPVRYRCVEVEYLVKTDAEEEKQNFVSKTEMLNEQVKSGKEILVERTTDKKNDVKTVNVAEFLKFFEIVEDGVMVFCRVLPMGTIRPDEILKLLDMDPGRVSTSVVRKRVHWQVEQ